MELKKFIATTIREYLNENKFTTSYGVGYSSLEEWAYDYAKEHAEGFNNYDEAKEYLDWFFKQMKTLPTPMILYRILQVDSKKFINKKSLGKHFTDSKDNFDENFLSSLGFSKGDIEEYKFYIVTIQVNLSEIDFENTIATRLAHSYEDEYTLKENANYKIIEVEQFLPNDRINF